MQKVIISEDGWKIRPECIVSWKTNDAGDMLVITTAGIAYNLGRINDDDFGKYLQIGLRKNNYDLNGEDCEFF